MLYLSVLVRILPSFIPDILLRKCSIGRNGVGEVLAAGMTTKTEL